MLTPRAAWLEEPHSVESDLSRSLSLSQAPPLRVRCQNGSFLRRHIDLRRHGGQSTCVSLAPTRLVLFRHRTSMSGTRSVVSWRKTRSVLVREESQV